MHIKYLKIGLLFFILVLGCNESRNKKTFIDKKIFNTKDKQIKEFYFVAKDRERFDIYKYNFEEKNSKRFWTDIKEKVIVLSYSPDLKNLYFVTSKYFGIRSTLTYIKRIKLYKIDLKSEKISLIDTLINGTQLNADWISNNAFQVVINVRDLQVSEYINKNTFVYNSVGKKLLSKTETINFIKDGYPLPVIKEPVEKSFKDYELKIHKENNDSLFIFDNQTSELHFVTNLKKYKLDEIFWNDENLIFTIMSKNKNLIIYSLNKKLIIKQINNIKNFIVYGKYLVYDFNIDLSSSISIFDLNNSEITDTIETKNGCGLRNAFN